MLSKNIIKASDKDRVKKIINFLNLGFKDYLASRVLLNSKLNLQGAIFASTAIEKYFKALLAFYWDKSEGHLKTSILNAVKNMDRKLYSSFNESFLKLLIKVYKLRYLDNHFDDSFNIQICNKQFLSELDYTVAQIQDRIVIAQGTQILKTAYNFYEDKKDPQLYENNHILTGIEKVEIIKQPNFVYAIAFTDNYNFLEITYETLDSIVENDFMKPGMIVNKQQGTA
ncbi:MAG: hypothetical protein IPJ03_02765 [Ignavibacteriales bacterium]|nr:hypothetical protein [Ignavibacteriales bacterium]